MEEPLHSLRLKVGEVEFELTSSSEEIAKARSALEATVLAALRGSASTPSERDDAKETGSQTERRKRASKTTAHRETGGERADVRARLLSASAEGFPALPAKPGAKWAAYAVLSWSNKTLGIDGLTPQEIQAFMSGKRRVKGTYQGYARALERRLPSGEVELLTNNPRVFRLMQAGEAALDQYLADRPSAD